MYISTLAQRENKSKFLNSLTKIQNSPRPKSEHRRASLPHPSGTAKFKPKSPPNLKNISLGFANPFPQNCFAKPSPYLHFTLRLI